LVTGRFFTRRRHLLWSNTSLPITGRNGRLIYNRIYQSSSPSTSLTIIVAGFGYSADSPYLFYSKHVPFHYENDVLVIDFEYSRDSTFLKLGEEERDALFLEELDSVATLLRVRTDYAQFSFIGKSLGTSAIFYLLGNSFVKEKTVRTIWLTPGEKRAEIEKLLLNELMPGMVVYGEEDRYAKNAPVAELSSRPGLHVLVVPGADHALETHSPRTSIQFLLRYLETLEMLYAGNKRV